MRFTARLSTSRANALAQAVNMGFASVSALLASIHLGVGERGQYSLITSLVALCVAVSAVGAQNTVVRQWRADAPEFAVANCLLALMMAVATGAIAGFVLSLRVGGAELVLVCSLFVLCQIVIELSASTLQGKFSFGRHAAVRLLAAAAPSAAVAIGTFFFTSAQSLFVLMTGVVVVAAFIATVLSKWWHLLQFGWRQIGPGLPLIRLGLQVWLVNVLLAVLYRGDVVLLGLIATDEAVGVYAVALLCLEALWLVVNARNLIVFPSLFGMSAIERGTRLRAELRHGIISSLALSPLVLLASWILSRAVLPTEYEDLSLIVLAMIPGMVSMTCLKTRLTFALSNSRLSITVMFMIVPVSIMAVVMISFASIFGVIGAAIGLTTTYIVSAILSRLCKVGEFVGS